MNIQSQNNNVNFGSLKANMALGEKVLKNFQDEFGKLASNTRIDAEIKNLEAMPELSQEKMERWVNLYDNKDDANIMVKNVRKMAPSKNPEMFKSYDDYMTKLKGAMKEWRAGNCEEHAAVVFDSLKQAGEKPVKLMIEFFKNQDPWTELVFGAKRITNHIFPGIGFAKNADFRVPESWGEEAVAVDAWAGFVKPAKEVPKYLEQYFMIKPKHQNNYKIDRRLTNVDKKFIDKVS